MFEARKWEISENLHRADLTPLERAEQTDEWVKLTDKDRVQSRQVGANESKREDGRGHRRESGAKAAARELGIKEQEVRRAKKIASISPEAKAAIREAPSIRNNQSALLKIASLPKDKQLAAVSAPLMSKAQRAAEAISRDPSKSDRAIAKEIGVSGETVRMTRKQLPNDLAVETTRTGLDGKQRKMPTRPVEDDEVDQPRTASFKL